MKEIAYLIIISFIILSLQFEEWWENSKVTELTDNNFFEVIGKDKYVVVEFFTKWCKYCRMMAPEYEKLYKLYKEKRKDIIIARIEGDANGKTLLSVGIFAFPLIALYVPEKTKIQKVFNGKRELSFFDQWLTDVAPVIQKKNLKKSKEKNDNEDIKEIDIGDLVKVTNESDYFKKEISTLTIKLDNIEKMIQKINGTISDMQNYTIDEEEIKGNKDKKEKNEDNKNKIIKSSVFVILLNPKFIFIILLIFGVILLLFYWVFNEYIFKRKRQRID